MMGREDVQMLSKGELQNWFMIVYRLGIRIDTFNKKTINQSLVIVSAI